MYKCVLVLSLGCSAEVPFSRSEIGGLMDVCRCLCVCCWCHSLCREGGWVVHAGCYCWRVLRVGCCGVLRARHGLAVCGCVSGLPRCPEHCGLTVCVCVCVCVCVWESVFAAALFPKARHVLAAVWQQLGVARRWRGDAAGEREDAVAGSPRRAGEPALAVRVRRDNLEGRKRRHAC